MSEKPPDLCKPTNYFWRYINTNTIRTNLPRVDYEVRVARWVCSTINLRLSERPCRKVCHNSPCRRDWLILLPSKSTRHSITCTSRMAHYSRPTQV